METLATHWCVRRTPLSVDGHPDELAVKSVRVLDKYGRIPYRLWFGVARLRRSPLRRIPRADPEAMPLSGSWKIVGQSISDAGGPPRLEGVPEGVVG